MGLERSFLCAATLDHFKRGPTTGRSTHHRSQPSLILTAGQLDLFFFAWRCLRGWKDAFDVRRQSDLLITWGGWKFLSMGGDGGCLWELKTESSIMSQYGSHETRCAHCMRDRSLSAAASFSDRWRCIVLTVECSGFVFCWRLTGLMKRRTEWEIEISGNLRVGERGKEKAESWTLEKFREQDSLSRSFSDVDPKIDICIKLTEPVEKCIPELNIHDSKQWGRTWQRVQGWHFQKTLMACKTTQNSRAEEKNIFMTMTHHFLFCPGKMKFVWQGELISVCGWCEDS